MVVVSVLKVKIITRTGLAERQESTLGRGKVGISSLDSIDFFVSIMLRYPEIATIKYDSLKSRLNFTFIVSGIVPSKEQKRFENTLINALEIFYLLNDKSLPDLRVVNTTCDKITVIEISRDVQTLCYDEIGLMVSLFRECFGKQAVIDPGELFEEDILLREERIKHTLESLKHTQLEKSLIALREEGQVRVFNK